ncbi:hypothetical protein ELG83_09545 [Rhizobium leguminosarum]|uniref:Uncharacterized protein n=3 Tax=Rhizobium/Agrobacterium group TaxID=227290 RepID=Q1MGW4_RHIJ3|nr:hypothetical protein [Rhizobium leguminosarum]NKK06263.1 hypothetical protein [Rhizobium leguminosarum bv. viciae]CAK07804.1 hypothetical protein RL2314 [Rhizobium johnstonii 3841]NEI00863.1 hypothetical protein [Rhizobium leguminosarum]NEI55981.1 hypothetical protein [Rhizobium leguminosarum]
MASIGIALPMACSTLMMRGVRGLVIGLYGKEKEMRYWLDLLAIGALVLQPLTVSQAQAANALERAIGDAQPCRSLKAKVSSFGITVQVGVDKLDSVKIENLQVSVNGDAAEASARGTLACKTSDEALVKGGFSATAEVHLKVDLATCKTAESSIEIVKTGGRFGDVVKGLETEISDALRRSLEKNLAKLCER